MAIGGISVAAFLIANSFGVTPRQTRLLGRIERVDDGTLRLRDHNSKEHLFAIAESATVFLNDQRVSIAKINEGRQGSVRFTKSKGKLMATEIELFPTYEELKPDGEGEMS